MYIHTHTYTYICVCVCVCVYILWPARLSGVLQTKIFTTEGRRGKMAGCKEGCKVQGGL